jgi:hypothetical protein
MKIGEIFAVLSIKAHGRKEIESYEKGINRVGDSLNRLGGKPKGGGKSAIDSTSDKFKNMIRPLRAVGSEMSQIALAVNAFTLGFTAVAAVVAKFTSVIADNAQSLEKFAMVTGLGEYGTEMVQRWERLMRKVPVPMKSGEVRAVVGSISQQQAQYKMYGGMPREWALLGMDPFDDVFKNIQRAVERAREMPADIGSMLLQRAGIDPKMMQANFSEARNIFLSGLNKDDIEAINEAFVTLRTAVDSLTHAFSKLMAWVARIFNVVTMPQKYIDKVLKLKPVQNFYLERELKKLPKEKQENIRNLLENRHSDMLLDDRNLISQPRANNSWRLNGNSDGNETNNSISQINNVTINSTASAEELHEEFQEQSVDFVASMLRAINTVQTTA